MLTTEELEQVERYIIGRLPIITLEKLEKSHQETRRELAEFRDEARQELAEFRDEARQELAEFKQETRQRFGEVDRRFAEAKADRDDIRADLSRLTVKVDKIDQDVGQLKGMALENNIFNKAPAIFGRYLSRGRNVTDHVLDLLHEAQEEGLVSEAEYTQVAAADMLWGGKIRQTKAEVVLVIEVSWKVAMHDVIRARDRAAILQKLALTALPVVMGKTWDEAALQAEGIVRVVDEALDSSSWLAITNV